MKVDVLQWRQLVAEEVKRQYSLADTHQQAAQLLLDEERALALILKELKRAREERSQAIRKRLILRSSVRAIRRELEQLRPARVSGTRTHRLHKIQQQQRELTLGALQKAAAPIDPRAAESGVYFLFRLNELIYIGQSVNVAARLGQHAHALRYDKACYIPCPAKRLVELERRAIDLFQPSHNSDARTRALRNLNTDATSDLGTILGVPR